MKTSEQIDKLAEALAKAQGQLKNPEKNKTVKVPTKSGSSYSYNYADLPNCFDTARKPLSENGLSHIYTTSMTEKGMLLIARLLHSSGQWVEAEYPIQRGDDKAMAASMTYGRRYLFIALTGMAADEDTDSQPEDGAQYGNKPPRPQSPPKPVIRPQVTQPKEEEDEKIHLAAKQLEFKKITLLKNELKISNEDLKAEVFKICGQDDARVLNLEGLKKVVEMLEEEKFRRDHPPARKEPEHDPNAPWLQESMGPIR